MFGFTNQFLETNRSVRSLQRKKHTGTEFHTVKNKGKEVSVKLGMMAQACNPCSQENFKFGAS